MHIDKSDLLLAAAEAGISQRQADELWTALAAKAKPGTKFDISQVLYYIGAMMVMVAMGWFLGLGWEHFGDKGIFVIALAYMALFVVAGHALWRKDDLKVPGGLFITVAVVLIPLAIYAFQRMTGWWVFDNPGQYHDYYTWVRGGWFLMEVGTLIGGCVAVSFYRFPFLTAPLFFTLWFMSMDITPLLFKGSADLWTDRLWVSIVFGLAMLVMAYLIDRKTQADFAFWGYFFGTLAFWFGISLFETKSEFWNFLYCLINIVLVLMSVFFDRKVFLIFGAFGILTYISSLFYRHFADSVLFPFILSLIGVAVVFVGVWYHRHHQKIEQALLDLVPQGLREWLPRSRH